MANDINKEDPHYKGEYGSIYEVNRKFPTGGVAGDFVVIEGWAHYWNADRGTWCVNAERDSYWDELITNIIEKFKLVRGATYMGVASLDTVPTKVIGAKMYYFATIAGTYKNFGDLVVPQGINVLYSENGSSWVNTTLLEVAQELGVSTNKVVSQKAVSDKLSDLDNKVSTQLPEIEKAKNEALSNIKENEQSAITNLNSQKVTPEMLSESTKQLIETSGGGTITNLADDEDIVSKNNGLGVNVLKFADIPYNTTKFISKGHKILRKNVVNGINKLSYGDVASSNTEFEVKYDFDYNNAGLGFDTTNNSFYLNGGTLNNMKLYGAGRKVLKSNNGLGRCENLTFYGCRTKDLWVSDFIRPSDFIQDSNEILLDLKPIIDRVYEMFPQSVTDNTVMTLHIDNGRYFVSDMITIRKGFSLVGDCGNGMPQILVTSTFNADYVFDFNVNVNNTNAPYYTFFSNMFFNFKHATRDINCIKANRGNYVIENVSLFETRRLKWFIYSKFKTHEEDYADKRIISNILADYKRGVNLAPVMYFASGDNLILENIQISRPILLFKCDGCLINNMTNGGFIAIWSKVVANMIHVEWGTIQSFGSNVTIIGGFSQNTVCEYDFSLRIDNIDIYNENKQYLEYKTTPKFGRFYGFYSIVKLINFHLYISPVLCDFLPTRNIQIIEKNEKSKLYFDDNLYAGYGYKSINTNLSYMPKMMDKNVQACTASIFATSTAGLIHYSYAHVYPSLSLERMSKSFDYRITIKSNNDEKVITCNNITRDADSTHVLQLSSDCANCSVKLERKLSTELDYTEEATIYMYDEIDYFIKLDNDTQNITLDEGIYYNISIGDIKFGYTDFVRTISR